MRASQPKSGVYSSIIKWIYQRIPGKEDGRFSEETLGHEDGESYGEEPESNSYVAGPGALLLHLLQKGSQEQVLVLAGALLLTELVDEEIGVFEMQCGELESCG